MECFKSYFQFIKQKTSLLFFLQAPLTRKDTLTLGGSLDVKNGNGSGSVSVAVKRTLSHRSWGEVSDHHWWSLITDDVEYPGVLPIVASVGRLCPKGVPRSSFRYIRVQNLQVEVFERVGKSAIQVQL